MLALLLAAVACAATPASQTRSVPQGPRHSLQVGGQVLDVELAAAPASRARGLMFRRSLGQNEGMLFVFSEPQPLSFWMRNTYLELDVGYFDADGVLREIYPLTPLDERPVSSQRRDLQYALEVPRGWFRQRSVAPGARLSLADLSRALEALHSSPSAPSSQRPPPSPPAAVGETSPANTSP